MNEESNKIKEYMKMNNKVMAKECLKSYKYFVFDANIYVEDLKVC